MTTNKVAARRHRRGLILVVLAAALWGTSGVATKTIYALVDISPISVAAFRLALGAPLLWAAFRLTSGQRSFRIRVPILPGCCWPAPRWACHRPAILRPSRGWV